MNFAYYLFVIVRFSKNVKPVIEITFNEFNELWLYFVNERKPASTDHVVFYELNVMQSSLGF